MKSASQAPQVVEWQQLPEVYNSPPNPYADHERNTPPEAYNVLPYSYKPATPPPPSSPRIPHRTPEKPKIMGLHKSTFILLIVLVLVIVVAAIGGGVGGSMAVEQARRNAAAEAASSPLPSTTSTSPSSATADGVFTAPTDVVINISCPEIDGKRQRGVFEGAGTTFMPTCGTDRIGGDLTALKAYSFYDCMMACVEYNVHFPNACRAFVLEADLTARTTGGGNCFLKNETTSLSRVKGMVSAEIVS